MSDPAGAAAVDLPAASSPTRHPAQQQPEPLATPVTGGGGSTSPKRLSAAAAASIAAGVQPLRSPPPPLTQASSSGTAPAPASQTSPRGTQAAIQGVAVPNVRPQREETQPHHLLSPNPASASAAGSSAPQSATHTPIPQRQNHHLPMHLQHALQQGHMSATGTPVPQPPHPAAGAGTASAHTTPTPQSPNATCPSYSAPGCPSLPILDGTSGQGGGGAAPFSAPPLQVQASGSSEGILLGVEALERQQAELERRRQVAAQEELRRAARLQQEAEQRHQLAQLHQQAALDAERQDQATAAAEQIGQGRGRPPLPLQSGESQDDDTAPSSTMGGQPTGNIGNGGVNLETPQAAIPPPRRTSSFHRFLKTPLKLRTSSSNGNSQHGDAEETVDDSKEGTQGSNALMYPPKDSDGLIEQEGMWDDDEVKPLVYGYLHKLGRNGAWQRRWFETDGMYLTYYKSRKRIKLLASLDLCHVGEIQMDSTDPTCSTFKIQVADRPYFLRAENEPLCKHWVINLNRVKEARLQVGNIQLVQPQFSHKKDGEASKCRSESDEVAPRVVMVANRPRTQALAPAETVDTVWQLLPQQDQNGEATSPPQPIPAPQTTPHTLPVNPMVAVASPNGSVSAPPSFDHGDSQLATTSQRSPRIISQLHPVVLAKWQKRKSNLHRLSVRLLRWARSMRMLKCMQTGRGDVVGSPDILTGGQIGADGQVQDFGFPVAHNINAQEEGGTESADSSAVPSLVPQPIGSSQSFEGTPNRNEWIDREKHTPRHSHRRVRSSGEGIGGEIEDLLSGEVLSVPSAGSGQVTPTATMGGGVGGYESDSSEARHLS